MTLPFNRWCPALFLLLWLAGDASCREPSQDKSPHGAHAPRRALVLYLIGDSTVKNGRDDGVSGMWGWGQVLAEHFDPQNITVDVNGSRKSDRLAVDKFSAGWVRGL